MDPVEWLERTVYVCEKVDRDRFPEPGEEILNYISLVGSYGKEKIRFFPFLRFSKEGVPFIDLYVWDPEAAHEDDVSYERFILAEGYRLSQRDERCYLYYCSQADRWMDENAIRVIEGACNRCFSQIHMKRYDSPKHMLLALYYSLHRSGNREILFKAQLEVLAAHIEELERDLLGKSPEEILGLSIKTLRMLNSKWGVYLLKNMTNEAYRADLDRMLPRNMGVLSAYQCLYILDASKDDVELNLDVLRHMRGVTDDGDYRDYCRYLERVEELRPYCNLPFDPGPIEDSSEYFIKADRLHGVLVRDRAKIDRAWYTRGKDRERYEYSDGRFCIFMPGKPEDLAKESERQSNCLWQYIEAHAYGKTTILFLRRSDARDRSFVTVEVDVRGRITQAYRRFNAPLEREEYRFLAKYCKENGLQMGIDQPFVA